jgi:hypothetical protein
MNDFYYIDVLIWLSMPTIMLFLLNLFCIFRKVHCPLKYYLYSLGVGFAGLIFGPSCMCNEIDQKAIGLMVFVLFVSAIFVFVIILRLFFFRGKERKGKNLFAP